MKNISKTIDVVISIFENNTGVFSSKDIKDKTGASDSTISQTISKLIENEKVIQLKQTKGVFIRDFVLFNTNKLCFVGEKIFEDAILTGNQSLFQQGIRTNKDLYCFDFLTFIGRNKEIEIEDFESGFEIKLRKDNLKNIVFYQSEINTNKNFLCYSAEKSFLDQIHFDLKDKKNREFDDEIFYDKFDKNKIIELSRFYKKEIGEIALKEIDMFEENKIRNEFL